MSKSRLRRLESDLGLDREPVCTQCGGIAPLQFLYEFIDPATMTAYEVDADGGPRRPPCAACGGRRGRPGVGLVISAIVVRPQQPLWLPRGRPKEEAVPMSEAEAARWHRDHGRAGLAAWFESRVNHEPEKHP